jgi:2-oxoglutarate decarboxylase
MGMAHRGRLNVLANIVGKSYGRSSRSSRGSRSRVGPGLGRREVPQGGAATFGSARGGAAGHLASNPSHLEAVDPVVEGMVGPSRTGPAHRGRPPDGRGHLRLPVLSVLVHGDAAFAGQGVVAETLNLSGSRATAPAARPRGHQQPAGLHHRPESARSSVYPTDVAKMVQAPIFHVNGDDPEACVRAARLAFSFRQTFHKDVVIDLVCYRRTATTRATTRATPSPGCTSASTPSARCASSTPRPWCAGATSPRGGRAALDDFKAKLQTVLDEVPGEPPWPRPTCRCRASTPDGELPAVRGDRRRREVLERAGRAGAHGARGFTIHPKLERQFAQRDEAGGRGQVDWALAEALAIGSCCSRANVRLTGQDTRRGTFSQRHAVLVDYATADEFIPLAHVSATARAGSTPRRWCPPAAALRRFTVRDSLLSEYAASGFEYGYSVEAPEALVAWEAQFGDFANGAQIIIDNFLVAAETSGASTPAWSCCCPTATRARAPSTRRPASSASSRCAPGATCAWPSPRPAAQYFHLLRSQALRSPKRP